MQIALLVTDKMHPIPKTVEILFDWGYVGITTNTGDYVDGDHMAIEGTESDIVNWLKPFSGMWRQKPGTSPMMQQFEVCHTIET